MAGQLTLGPAGVELPHLPLNYMPAGLAALRGEDTNNRLGIPLVLSGEKIVFANFPAKLIKDPSALNDEIGRNSTYSPGKIVLGPPALNLPFNTAQTILEFPEPIDFVGSKRRAVVIIDVGIAFWNDRFLTSQGESRFHDVQYLDHGKVIIRPGKAPFGAPKITRWRRFALERIGSDDRKAIIDTASNSFGNQVAIRKLKDKFPRSFFGTDPAPDGFWHGTAVADLAAGGDDDTLLFGVELPQAALVDYGGDTLQAVLPAAFGAALRMTEKLHLPTIVVLAFACPAGPHDGTHPVAGLITDFVGKLKARDIRNELVLPAGNHLQDRCCAQLPKSVDHNSTPFITWSLAPNDNSPNTVEICVEHGEWKQITLQGPGTSLLTIDNAVPSNDKPFRLQAEHFASIILEGEIIGGIHHLPTNNGKAKLRLSLAHTKYRPGGKTPVPAGDWTIGVRAGSAVNLWILRDDRDDTGRTPSMFSDPAYRERNSDGTYVVNDIDGSKIRRAGTASIYTTAGQVFPVSAAESLDGGPNSHAAPYSGKTFDLGLDFNFPQLVDVGESFAGQPAVHNGTSVIMERFTGTSAAAAMAARHLPPVSLATSATAATVPASAPTNP